MESSTNKLKAQASIELLVMLAIGMVVITIVIFFSQQQLATSTGTLNVQQAQAAVDSLARAVDSVYASGVGSMEQVQITIPEGTISTSVSDKTIGLRMRTASGETDVNARTAANVYGSIPFQPGEYRAQVWVSAEENRVRIGLQALQVDSLLVVSVFKGNQTQYLQRNVTVLNGGNSSLQINLSLVWPYSDVLLNFTNQSDSYFVLGAGGSKTIGLNITVSSSALGAYAGSVVASANDGGTASTQVSVSVTYQYQMPSVAYMNIQTFNDSTYSMEKKIFELPDVVSINGSSWDPSSSVTLNLTNPSGVTVAGYPKVVATDSSGKFSDAWNPAGEAAGIYTLYANDSSATSSTAFSVIECS
jgi:uncharacterized protein (UPF0333 family)